MNYIDNFRRKRVKGVFFRLKIGRIRVVFEGRIRISFFPRSDPGLVFFRGSDLDPFEALPDPQPWMWVLLSGLRPTYFAC